MSAKTIYGKMSSLAKIQMPSTMGKRLLTKCRMLIQENEELGRMTSSGRISKLEADLAVSKSACEELKKSQTEIDDFLLEMDEDMEGMQTTIMFLQQQVSDLRAENQHLRHLVAKNGDVDLADSASHDALYSDFSVEQPTSSKEESVGLKGVEEIDSAESIGTYSMTDDGRNSGESTFADADVDAHSPAWIENNSDVSFSSWYLLD
ncbi:unnamed protein product [Soboliphyme baturini]|uniref:MADS-box domain-containing protein n=1 Tax=Soboliphyme baturini TaxID=241478 RepID=A0A183ILQ7_9BILA|nr:unnamed protein product [Soboliphyme baturini]